MVNAWSLLYDELYGDDEMSETKYWYDYDRNTSYDWGDDGFSMTGNPNASPDTICFGGSKSNDTIAFTGSRVPGGAGSDGRYCSIGYCSGSKRGQGWAKFFPFDGELW